MHCTIYRYASLNTASTVFDSMGHIVDYCLEIVRESDRDKVKFRMTANSLPRGQTTRFNTWHSDTHNAPRYMKTEARLI